MVAFPLRLEVPRFSDISLVQPLDIQLVMEQPSRGKPMPSSQAVGGGRIGTVAGWLVGKPGLKVKASIRF